MSDTECMLEWSVYTVDAEDIDRFTVTCEVVHGSTPATSISVSGTARRYRLTDLQPATE